MFSLTIINHSHSTDLSDVVIGTDLNDIVDSICKDGGFPESPPDSGKKFEFLKFDSLKI